MAKTWFDVHPELPKPNGWVDPTTSTTAAYPFNLYQPPGLPPLPGAGAPTGVPPAAPVGPIPGTPSSVYPSPNAVAPSAPPLAHPSSRSAGGNDYMSQLLNFHNSGMLGSNDPVMGVASQLLNPNDAQANYDVSMHGAEAGVGRGIAGSGAAAETTGRLRQSDIERRAALGSSLVSDAVNRAVQSGRLQLDQSTLDLKRQIETGQLSLDQARLAVQDKIQSGQLSLENGRLVLDWFRTLNPGAGGSGNNRPSGGGGGVPSSSPTGGHPSWRTGVGGGLPPYPGDVFSSGAPGWSDTNPDYTTNPYTNPQSPYYTDPGQGYDYVPPGGFDFNQYLDQGFGANPEDYYA